MPVYEAKRAVIGTLPDLVLTPPPTLSALLDDFELQLGETVMKGMICNIMQYTSKSFLLHLASPEQVQELVANGLTFRSHPVHIEPCRSFTNVTLERVPYGLPGSTVMSALRPYGNCKGARPVQHKGFGISKLIVEIELTKDIPSRIYIQGNPINVFYRNQPRSCFVCSEKGHEAKSCPKKRAKKRPADASNLAATDPGDKRVCNTVPPTFANVVSGASPSALPAVSPVTTEPQLSGPPVDVITDQSPVVVEKVIPDAGTDGASSVDPPPARDLPSDQPPVVVQDVLPDADADGAFPADGNDAVAMDSSVSPPPATTGPARDSDAGNSSTTVPPPANTEPSASDGVIFTLPTDPLDNILAESPKDLVPRPPLVSSGSSDNSPDLFSQCEPASDGGGVSARRSSRPKVISTARRKSLRSDDGFGKMKSPTSSVFLSRKQCSPSPLPTSRSRSLSSLNTNRFAPLSMDNDGDNVN